MHCKTDGDETEPCHGSSGSAGPQSFGRIVHDYRENYQQDQERLLNYYASRSSFERAVEVIAFAKRPSGKRHSHQQRLKSQSLEKVYASLIEIESRLKECGSFAELFETVEDAIADIWGIGELMVYDTAHRLGAYFELEPDKVYLHRGTKEGARALGLDTSAEKVDVADLPEPLRALKPYELEDCLCIYKDNLRQISRRTS